MTTPPVRPGEKPWIAPAVMSALFLALGVWFMASGTFWPGVGMIVVAGLWSALAQRERQRSAPRR